MHKLRDVFEGLDLTNWYHKAIPSLLKLFKELGTLTVNG